MSSLDIQCPNPSCDHEAPFGAFHDPPDTGCDACGTDLETLQAFARGDDDAE